MSSPPPSDNVFIGNLPVGVTQEQVAQLFASYGTVLQTKTWDSRQGNGAAALVRFSSVDEATSVVNTLNGSMLEGGPAPIVVRFANAPGTSRSEPYGGGKGGSWSPGGGKGGDWSDGGKGGKGWSGSDWGKGGGDDWSKGGGKDWGKGGGKDWGKGGGKGCGKKGSIKGLHKAVKASGMFNVGDVPMENQVFIQGLPLDTTDADLYRLFAPFGAMAPTGAKAMKNMDGSCKGFGFVDYLDAACANTACKSLNGIASTEGATTLQVSIKVAKDKTAQA